MGQQGQQVCFCEFCFYILLYPPNFRMGMDGYGRYEDPLCLILMGSHRLFIAQKSFFSGDHNSDNMTYPIDLGEHY